ncbi:MAG TPA: hypothetical protein VMW83_13215 [Spirochaetia bacterium]|nr:hypothetical protein [Spirochaetia bacterium]
MNPIDVLDKDLKALLTSEIFLNLFNCKALTIAELQAAVGLLLKAGITFDLTFDRATPRSEGVALLVVFITPIVQLRFTLSLGCGPALPAP